MATISHQPTSEAPGAGLKPMHLSSATRIHSRYSNGGYDPVPPETFQDWELRSLEAHDSWLKKRIRVLRVVARALATICSIVTLVPLVMTIVKFLQTRNVYYEVNGVKRTAWAMETITWYASIAAISFILNFAVMVSYLRGIKRANKTDQISTIWSWITVLSHVITWAVAASVYRYGKEPVDGKFKDMWGWTCSQTAADLQELLTGVDFDKYCRVQTSSFYADVANTVLGILTGVIMVFTLLRSKSKKRMKRVTFSREESEMDGRH